MQITRETDYALRCLYYLVRRPEQVCMVDEIAAEMEIPRSFLAKIARKLAAAGLVVAHRGVGGGFMLIRKPETISIHEVICAIEGEVALNICTGEEKRCQRSDHCPLHPVWVNLRRDVEALLQARNFAELLP